VFVVVLNAKIFDLILSVIVASDLNLNLLRGARLIAN